MVSGHLSKELRKKYNKRTFGLHRGDTVKILKGKFKGKSGNVESVVTKKNRIYIEGIDVQKTSGAKTKVSISAPNVVITDLNLDDKYRKKLLESSQKNAKGVQKSEAKKEASEKEVDKTNSHDARGVRS